MYVTSFLKILLHTCNGERLTKLESAKWRALRAHAPYVPYVLTCSTCPTCPRAHVYFTDWKIKKWKFCTHTFLRLLSLILGLNFRNYRFIQTSWLSLFSSRKKSQVKFFSYNKLIFCSNNVNLKVFQKPYINIWI